MTGNRPVNDPTPGVGADRAEASGKIAGLPPAAQLPAVLPPEHGPRSRHRLRRGWLLLVLLPAAAAVGYWWFFSQPALPPGIAWSNGRLEADEIDIDTKFAGRIAKLFVDEGDMVSGGPGRRDDGHAGSRGLAEKIAGARRPGATRARRGQGKSRRSSRPRLRFAKQELDRTAVLVPKGFATVEQLDQRRQQMAARDRRAGCSGAAGVARRSMRSTPRPTMSNSTASIFSTTRLSPRATGRIEYRVTNVGEVLPAGGKVFTMLDTSYVYMDIYLPTAEAGHVTLGSDARIVLDAYPDHVSRPRSCLSRARRNSPRRPSRPRTSATS